MKTVRVLLLATTLALLGAAPASADDASVVSAYDARQPSGLKTAVARYVEARKRWDRSRSARAVGAIIRADKRINAVLKRIERAVEAQRASSDKGRNGRSLALREIRGWRRANALERRGLRALLEGRQATAVHLGERATRTFNRCVKLGRRAARAFAGAGHAPAYGPVSDGKP